MLIAGIIAVCIILAILGFMLPRISDHAAKGTDKTLGVGQKAGSKAPGPIGRLLSKSVGKSRKAANKSHSKGKEARSKTPV